MTPGTVVHHKYEFSVLFAVPLALAKRRDIVPSDDWHTAPPKPATGCVRTCRLDEYSDYGFLTDPLSSERGPGSPTYGFLLADALIDPQAVVQTFEELPSDWNFGGLIAIDMASGFGVNTNCELGETMQWHRILELLNERSQVKATFTLTDTGVSLEKREGDVLMQQLAWEVPHEWGPQGQFHYPHHRFLGEDAFLTRLKNTLAEFDSLCRQIDVKDSWAAKRLRGVV